MLSHEYRLNYELKVLSFWHILLEQLVLSQERRAVSVCSWRVCFCRSTKVCRTDRNDRRQGVASESLCVCGGKMMRKKESWTCLTSRTPTSPRNGKVEARRCVPVAASRLFSWLHWDVSQVQWMQSQGIPWSSKSCCTFLNCVPSSLPGNLEMKRNLHGRNVYQKNDRMQITFGNPLAGLSSRVWCGLRMCMNPGMICVRDLNVYDSYRARTVCDANAVAGIVVRL